MKIAKIQVSHFRALQELHTFELRDPLGKVSDLLVISGPNGSGKTSVLEAVVLAVGREVDHFWDGDLSYLGYFEFEDAEVDLELEGGSLDELEILYHPSWRALTQEDRLCTLESMDVGLVDEVWQHWNKNAFPWEQSSVIRDAALGLVLPQEEARLVFQDKTTGRTRPLRHAGSGALDWLPLLVELRRKPPHVLLIDQPELHLFPQWQSQMLRALQWAAPETQIIMATTAAAPWDQAMSFERYFLCDPRDPRHESHCADQ